jgi:phage-related protein
MADGTIVIDTRIDQKGAINGMKGLESSLTPMLKKIGSLIAVAFSAKALLSFTKASIEVASDIQEVQNVVDVAFGDMAYKMEEFADTAITQYGISRLEAKKTGSTMMAMAKGMGLASDEASDMAITLTGLSADMASFYNITQDRASIALKSVFTGETETLKQYGIVMTEVNLQEYAYQQGINKKYQAMTQAEKVQLRYNYVLEQTKLAQGDFARTQGSWANQTRILSEQWKEFMSVIGTGLIQVLTPAIRVLNQFLSSLIAVARNLASFLGVDLNVSNATAESADNTEALAGAMDNTADSTKKANKAGKQAVATFDDLNVLQKDSDSGAGGAGGGASTKVTTEPATQASNAMAGLANGFLDTLMDKLSDLAKFFAPITDQLKKMFSHMWDVLKKGFIAFVNDIANKWQLLCDVLSSPETLYAIYQTFEAWISNMTIIFDILTTVIGDLWSHFASPVIDSFITNILPVLIQLFGELSQTVNTVMQEVQKIFDAVWKGTVIPVLDLATEVITGFFSSIKQFWDKWGKPIFDALRVAITNVGDTVLNIYNTVLKPVLDHVIAGLKVFWENSLKPLIDNVLDFIGNLGMLLLELWNNILYPLVNAIVDVIGPPIVTALNGLWDVLQSIFSGVVTAIDNLIDVIDSVVSALRGVITFITDVFKGNWLGAWQSVKAIFSNIWQGIKDVCKAVVNLIIGFVNALINGVETALNFVIDCLNVLSFEVPSWVPGIGGQTWGFDIEHIDFGEIPELATGAVLPANHPFLAMLGDQKSGTNIEAPLDTIKQALSEVMGQGVGGGSDAVMELDGQTFARLVMPYITNEMNRRGYDVKILGV